MGTLGEFDEPSAICADADRPGQLYAYIDEKLAHRIAHALARMDAAHGHKRFYADGEPLLWGVTINTPLKDAFANGFSIVDDPSAYDQWIAALDEAAAFLRSEKAEYERELAITMCARCGHPLATHWHKESPDLSCTRPGCGCPEFPVETSKGTPSPRALRLIKGGKPPKGR